MSAAGKRYRVVVAENSHYQDASERYPHGSFDRCEDAVAACRTIVDEYLVETYKTGMTSNELYRMYITFGEDPHIVSDDAACRFSAWDYAKRRCAALCGGSSQA